MKISQFKPLNFRVLGVEKSAVNSVFSTPLLGFCILALGLMYGFSVLKQVGLKSASVSSH
jgi:hypothetical protein